MHMAIRKPVYICIYHMEMEITPLGTCNIILLQSYGEFDWAEKILFYLVPACALYTKQLEYIREYNQHLWHTAQTG